MRSTSTLRFFLSLSLLALASGCGSGSGDGDDAGVDGGASVDADTTPDAAIPGAATVTVLDADGDGVADVDVVFHDPDGAVVAHEKTGADGSATADIIAGAMVTIADPEALELFTLQGIAPGDMILFRDLDGGDDEPVGSATVELPGIQAGANRYQVTAGCNEVTVLNPLVDVTGVEVRPSCSVVDGGDRLFHVFAQAVDVPVGPMADPPEAIRYAIASGVEVADPASVTLNDWSTFETVSVSVTSPPAGALVVVVDGSFTLAGGVAFDVEQEEQDAFILLGPPAEPFSLLAPAEAATYLADVGLVHGEIVGMDFVLNGVSFRQIATQGLPSAEVAVDLSADLLPAIGIDGFDAGEPARPALSWSGSGAGADVLHVALEWIEDSVEHSWSVFGDPASGSSFQFPELPADLAALRPTGDSTYEAKRVVYFAASYITDPWSALRQDLAAFFVTPVDTAYTSDFALDDALFRE